MPLYQPTNISPSDLYGVPYVFPSVGLTASWQVNGTNNTALVAYELLIMENTVQSTLLYDTGKVTLDAPFYGYDINGNPQTFTAQKITSATLAENNIIVSAKKEYKMIIIQWWNANDSVRQTSASVFKCATWPQMEIAPVPTITKASHTFTATYTQAEGIPLEWAKWRISNYSTNEVVAESGKLYNVGELTFSYDGFMPGTYWIYLEGSMQGDVLTDFGMEFQVEYNTTHFKGYVDVCPLRATDAVQLTFPQTIWLDGEGTGDWSTGEYRYLRTVSGNGSISVSDAASSFVNALIISAEPQQEGSGTPSASNVRHFRKWDGVYVYSYPMRSPYTTMFPSADNAYIENETLKGIDDEAEVSGTTLQISASSNFRVYGRTLCDSAAPAYGFTLNMISGALTIPYGHIESYNGEALPGAWLSSMDVYAEGTLPSMGAEVVYTLASPIEYQTDAHEIGLTNLAANTLTVYGYTPGSAERTDEPQWDMQFTYYSHGSGTSLMLPADTDSVAWGTWSAPLNIAAEFSVAIEAIVSQESGEPAMHPKVGITAIGHDNLYLCWTNEGFEIDEGLLNPIYAPAFTLETGDTLTVMLTAREVSVVVNRGQTTERQYNATLPEWQSKTDIISLNGPQTVGYLWVMDGEMTAAQRDDVMRGIPAFGNGTEMLADFTDELNAGAVHSDVPISKFHIYRKDIGASHLKKIATIGADKKKLRDYAAVNGVEHKYWISAENTNGDLSAMIESDGTTPMMWNYTLLVCDAANDGTYRVNAEYRFSLDIASGTVSNNSKATMQANFTRFPTRQPTTQNYRSGTLSAYIGKAENGRFADSMQVIKELREISTSTLPKFLKMRKGEIMRIETSDPITFAVGDKYAAQPVKIGLPWVEVDDAENSSVITIIGAEYWPE